MRSLLVCKTVLCTDENILHEAVGAVYGRGRAIRTTAMTEATG